MSTIKIKLVFSPEVKSSERKMKLETWAMAMLKKDNLKIVEEKHYEKLSWIVVENSKVIQNEYNLTSRI